MVYDLFSYNGEEEMLRIRLELLSPHVDRFVIAEGNRTFSGKPKEFTLPKDVKRMPNVTFVPVNLAVMQDEEIVLQMNDRPYVDQPHFQKAFYQKESLRTALKRLNPDPDDVVYYGDVDEVWKPKEPHPDGPAKLRQLAYSYWLNNRSPEDWRGTVIAKWKDVHCLNDLRANPERIIEDGGWHFTNLGGYEFTRDKIEAYDHQEVNIPFVNDSLKDRIERNEDFLGRGWQFWEDASDLPIWIIENREEFKKKNLWR